jgi:hypothetical protein
MEMGIYLFYPGTGTRHHADPLTGIFPCQTIPDKGARSFLKGGCFKPVRERVLQVNEERRLSYQELYAVADRVLELGEDDPGALVQALDRLDPEVREELLFSDFLNAYQVFYYFFREDPGDLERDRLTLEPASAVLTGVKVTEIEFYEVIFLVESGEPVIAVHKGPGIVASFRGKEAYESAMQLIEEAP